MSHYYENDPTLDQTRVPYTFEIGGKTFRVNASAGVFSKDKLDTGTRILCDYLIEPAVAATLGKQVLDLGCGIGVIGVILSAFHPCTITGIDPNAQACALAKENYACSHVEGSVLEQDHINDAIYDTIVLNPPIRAGKSVIYSLFEQSFRHLHPAGSLYIVMRKQHGAKSAQDYLDSLGFQTERAGRDKGFWIIRAIKPAA